tara:strand:+ start:708 stop:818 length:111 start_codon:yes stop_codon:yes gene_type:complete
MNKTQFFNAINGVNNELGEDDILEDIHCGYGLGEEE